MRGETFSVFLVLRAIRVSLAGEGLKVILKTCDACTIRIGGIEEAMLYDFKGHRLCSWCISEWKKLDEREGRETGWEEFMNPSTRLLARLGKLVRQMWAIKRRQC